MNRARPSGVAALACGVLAFAASACLQAPASPEGQSAGGTPPRAETSAASAGSVRVLSWNVSSDAFVRDPAAFRALVRKAQADILLLDEVAPSASEKELRDALAGLTAGGTGDWHIDVGRSGGRQRGVIASRLPLERLPEFADIVPYPDDARRRIHDRMVAQNELDPRYSMDGGIPMNGAVVLAGARRLLVVTTDLQCCGNNPGSWQEDRRRVETLELRRRVRQVLDRTSVDGIIVAGDFNLVSTALPLVYASGPYRAPHAGLIAAELRHLDGSETWTIDNRGTPFAPQALDFVLYSPHALRLGDGYVLDTEDLPPAELEQLGLERESAGRLSDHRPLVAEFVWQ